LQQINAGGAWLLPAISPRNRPSHPPQHVDFILQPLVYQLYQIHTQVYFFQAFRISSLYSYQKDTRKSNALKLSGSQPLKTPLLYENLSLPCN